MPAFSGKYYNKVDPKGRLIIPAPFREILSANYSAKLFVANDAFEQYLHMYPLEEWARLEEKIRALPKTNKSVRFFMRRVIASAVEIDVDRQGRVLIPSAHREDTGIKEEVVIVGQIDNIEVWDRSLWDKAIDPAGINQEELEAELSAFGL